MKELVLGAGNHKKNKVLFREELGREYQNPVFVDIDPDSNPDVIHDLNSIPYPFNDNEFDEIHAYEILEHLGTQGDWRFFFDQFAEMHRILKNYGYLFISVPDGNSRLAWVDPGHTFGFLQQSMYEEQVGKSAIADYRHYWKKNFRYLQYEERDNRLYVVLRKEE